MHSHKMYGLCGKGAMEVCQKFYNKECFIIHEERLNNHTLFPAVYHYGVSPSTKRADREKISCNTDIHNR